MGFFRTWISVAISLCCAASADAGEISVDSWSIGCSVVGNGLGSDHDGTGVVQNPLQILFHATLPTPGGATSTCDGESTATWDARGFFQMTVFGEHAAVGNPVHLYSRSTGAIFLTPAVTSDLSIAGVYNHIIAGGIRMAFLDIDVFDATTNQPIFSEFRRSFPIFGDPAIGELNISGNTTLSSGTRYILQYTMQLDSQSGSPSVLSTGNGTISFEIAPVPEPTTLALILPFAALLSTRRARR